MKVLPARRALVYSFLNLNYLEQKHCCLKSAFSGAYFSRLPLTQDWLPFSGLTRPHMTPDPLTQTFPCHFYIVLQGCGIAAGDVSARFRGALTWLTRGRFM